MGYGPLINSGSYLMFAFSPIFVLNWLFSVALSIIGHRDIRNISFPRVATLCTAR